MRNLEVIGVIIHNRRSREIIIRFHPAIFAQATITDGSGTITLNLWRYQVNIVGMGDIIRVKNVFIKEFSSRPEFNTGSDGMIEVIKGASSS